MIILDSNKFFLSDRLFCRERPSDKNGVDLRARVLFKDHFKFKSNPHTAYNFEGKVPRTKKSRVIIGCVGTGLGLKMDFNKTRALICIEQKNQKYVLLIMINIVT